MYSNQRLRDLQKSYTEKLVSPLDEDYIEPTYETPIISTEDTYEEVLGPKRAENNIKLAELAKDVYQEPNKRLSEWDDYQYQTKYSNKHLSTYTKDGNIIFAIKGTSELEDLVLDLETPSGILLNKRFKNLLDIVNNAINDLRGVYGEVIFTGHSLGGLLSQMMGKQVLDSRGVTFNTVTAPWLEQGESNRIRNYRIIGDPISKSKTFGKQINLRPKVPTDEMTKLYRNDQPNVKLPHSIDQFIDRKILEDDPNIYTKRRFEYWTDVVKNLVNLGFSYLLYSKIYPILVSRMLPPQYRARQVSINDQFSFLQHMGISNPEILQPINQEQTELLEDMFQYVNNLRPVQMLSFFNTLSGVLMFSSPNYLKPIGDTLADAFEEIENPDDE